LNENYWELEDTMANYDRNFIVGFGKRYKKTKSKMMKMNIFIFL